MIINCIIVDDEPLAVTLLENHISKVEGLKLVGKAGSAMEAYKLMQSRTVDLMFLDIKMPNLDGIQFLKSLSQKPKTIFTTAYREFAIEGFELEVVDYILKPVAFERFFKAVERVLRKTSFGIDDDFIILKSDGFQRKILLNDIVYIESQGNDVKVVLRGDKSVVSKSKIGELEWVLQEKGFIRIHRSFIIHSKFVTAYNQAEVLIGGLSIPVGRNYKKAFDSFVADISVKRLL